MGNGEVKELICMTQGHELRGRCWWEEGDTVWKGIKGRKKWDNCNCIINKIYLKENLSAKYIFFYSVKNT